MIHTFLYIQYSDTLSIYITRDISDTNATYILPVYYENTNTTCKYILTQHVLVYKKSRIYVNIY